MTFDIMDIHAAFYEAGIQIHRITPSITSFIAPNAAYTITSASGQWEVYYWTSGGDEQCWISKAHQFKEYESKQGRGWLHNGRGDCVGFRVKDCILDAIS